MGIKNKPSPVWTNPPLISVSILANTPSPRPNCQLFGSDTPFDDDLLLELSLNVNQIYFSGNLSYLYVRARTYWRLARYALLT